MSEQAKTRPDPEVERREHKAWRAAHAEMERWGIHPSYLPAVVSDVMRAVMAELGDLRTVFASCRFCETPILSDQQYRQLGIGNPLASVLGITPTYVHIEGECR